MNVRPVLACFLCLVLAPLAAAQDFAGLGSGGEGFAEVVPGQDLHFPADHGAHPAYRIEWWYVTANMEGADGRQYGVQWTLFRQAIRPDGQEDGWASPQLWMGHAAVTSAAEHRNRETFARGGIGQAGVDAEPFRAWIDSWALEAPDGAADLSTLAMRAAGPDFRYDLTLEAEGPLILHGDAGYSVKSPAGQASYYYSQPFFSAEGKIVIDGDTIPVTGTAWLDREWSSQPLAADQEGWDWFSMHLADGAKLMLFQLRDTGDGRFRAGTWIGPDGEVLPLQDGDITLSPLDTQPVAGRDIPTRWRATVAPLGLTLDIRALNPESWMSGQYAYWEGPVTITGDRTGEGYLEMTGY